MSENEGTTYPIRRSEVDLFDLLFYECMGRVPTEEERDQLGMNKYKTEEVKQENDKKETRQT